MSSFFERLEGQLHTAAESQTASRWARLRTRSGSVATAPRPVPALVVLTVTVVVAAGVALVALNIGTDAHRLNRQSLGAAGVTTTTASGPPECNTSTGTPQHLQEGPCVLNGSSAVIVNKTSTLHLKSLDATYVGIHTDGKLTITTLRIKNKLASPQRWQHTMAAFYIAGAHTGAGYGPYYLENLGAEVGDRNSCLWTTGTAAHGGLQPGQSVTCDVVFDLPASADPASTGNGLLIANFGDDVSTTDNPVGTIRTYQ